MRRALAAVFTLVVLTATPAVAREPHAHDVSVHPAPAVDLVAGEEGEHSAGRADDGDDGRDGTDPAAFAALLLAGGAAVAAMAALIFATKRAPS